MFDRIVLQGAETVGVLLSLDPTKVGEIRETGLTTTTGDVGLLANTSPWTRTSR